MPQLLVFAGPNGSGKSTIQESWEFVGTYINADEIKKAKKCSDLEAAQEAEKLREHHLEHLMDFTFETVLSTPRNIDLLRRAVSLGYDVTSVFVLTADPEVNVLRVRSRVAKGGHDVPEQKTRDRYWRSLANIPELRSLSKRFEIFDNTDKPSSIFMQDRERFAIRPNAQWSEADIRKLVGLDAAGGDPGAGA